MPNDDDDDDGLLTLKNETCIDKETIISVEVPQGSSNWCVNFHCKRWKVMVTRDLKTSRNWWVINQKLKKG